MYFGSDNQTGASAQVLDMLTQANNEYTHGYGDDRWTEQAVEALKAVFECDLEAYFVATGTAANSLALSCMVQPWEGILCHDSAHRGGGRALLALPPPPLPLRRQACLALQPQFAVGEAGPGCAAGTLEL